MIATPDLSIIIVSWNVRELLYACLQSIEASRTAMALELIVVDSASSDSTVEMVKTSFPWVTMIACNENVGFPRGNNIGMAQANGRYILLLNPDTEIVENALLTMLQYMEGNQDVGVVGAQLLNTDGSVQSSRRRFPTLLTGFFESTWLQGLVPALLRDYYMEDASDSQPVDVDWVIGACMFMRQDVMAQVGNMDEAYYMYSEELDLCRRIKTAGWRVVYLPDAQVKHHYGKSSEQAVTSRHINFNRAKLRYFRKYHGRFFAFVLRLFLLISYLGQIIMEGIKGLVGHQRPLRWQRVKSYWTVIRSGLRPAGY